MITQPLEKTPDEFRRWLKQQPAQRKFVRMNPESCPIAAYIAAKGCTRVVVGRSTYSFFPEGEVKPGLRVTNVTPSWATRVVDIVDTKFLDSLTITAGQVRGLLQREATLA